VGGGAHGAVTGVVRQRRRGAVGRGEVAGGAARRRQGEHGEVAAAAGRGEAGEWGVAGRCSAPWDPV
jgi:hypothetical protein